MRGVAPTAESVEAMESNGMVATVTDLAMAQALNRHASRLEVFVKVDVGLERLGVAAEEATALFGELQVLKHLQVTGIYTHMHVPSGSVDAYLDWQFDRFNRALRELQGAGYQPPVRMVASTPVIAHSLEMNLNAVDPGRAFLGFERWGTLSQLGLRPALHRITSRLLQVRTLRRDAFAERVPFDVRPGMVFGVIPIGLYDGLDRLNAGEVLVCGRRAPILAISIEHCRIDLSAIPGAQPGEEVVVVGRRGNEGDHLRRCRRRSRLSSEHDRPPPRDSLPRVHLNGPSAQ